MKVLDSSAKLERLYMVGKNARQACLKFPEFDCRSPLTHPHPDKISHKFDAHLAESPFQTRSREDMSAWRIIKVEAQKGFHFLLYDHCYSLYNNKTFNHHHSFPYFTAAVMIHRHHSCREQENSAGARGRK